MIIFLSSYLQTSTDKFTKFPLMIFEIKIRNFEFSCHFGFYFYPTLLKADVFLSEELDQCCCCQELS